MANFQNGDIFVLNNTATPDGGINYDFDYPYITGPVSFTVPANTLAGGPNQILLFGASVITERDGVSGDVLDLVIDGTTVYTSPQVPWTGAGNYLSTQLLLTPGTHIVNLVSHLIPLAGQNDPYGGGTVPSGYTSVDYTLGWSNQAFLIAVPSVTAAWTNAGGATVTWTAPSPAAPSVVVAYELQYSVHGANQWTAVSGLSAATLSYLVTGLNSNLSYDVQVAVALTGAGYGNFTSFTLAAYVAPYSGAGIGPAANVYAWVEALAPFFPLGGPLFDAAFLDSYRVPSSAVTINGGTRFFGLTQFLGQTVAVWAAGLYCGGVFTVQPGGYVDVPYGSAGGLYTAACVDGVINNGYDGQTNLVVLDGVTAMPCIVGFNYTSQGQIVRPAAPQESGAQNGPAQGKNRRVHQISAILQDTQAISFGTTPTNLLEATLAAFPSASPFPVTKLFSGVYWQPISDLYSYDGMVMWQISTPYPATVVNVGVFLETNDR